MLRRFLRYIMTPDAVKKVPIPHRGVDYRGKVVLAPMVRSGELPSRLLALHYGADLVWGPETVDRSMIGTTRRENATTGCIEWVRQPSHGQAPPAGGAATVDDATAGASVIYRLHPVLEAGRHVFQLGTSDPARAVACARLVAADVAGLDVNAGCPKPFSTAGGMGAALLRAPDRLEAILRALARDPALAAAAVGVSVKIRLLDDPAETEALVRRLVATGITGLTVHCRTVPMRPRERAVRSQLRMVAAVCREAGVACVMNGDVGTRDEAVRLMAEFGADGAMIATAAERNPSCFRAAAAGGLLPWRDVVERYVSTAMEVHNRFGNTKYLLGQMVPGKAREHRLLAQARNYEQICGVMGMEAAVAQAREVDISLDITLEALEAAKKKGKKAKNTTALAAGGNMSGARAADHQKKSLSDRAPAADAGPEAPLAPAGALAI